MKIKTNAQIAREIVKNDANTIQNWLASGKTKKDIAIALGISLPLLGITLKLMGI